MAKFRILCVRCDRIGDLLVSTPVIHRLRVLYPEAELNVVTSPGGSVALEGNPDIDTIFIYDKKRIASWLKLMPVLLKKHDMVVGFNKASSTIRLLCSLARGGKKRFLNTGNLAPWSGDPNVVTHFSARMLRELEAEFDLPHDTDPDIGIHFHVPEDVERNVREAYPVQPGLKRVGIFIGNIKKVGIRWPIEKFVELSQLLLEKNSGLEVYVVAGQSDVPLLDGYKDISHDRLHTFVGRVSMQHTAAFLKTCDAFVTCSSSPQHLAGAMKVPTVSITYPRSEARWTPRGPLNFSAVSEVDDNVHGITVKQVYETLNKSMEGFLAPWQE